MPATSPEAIARKRANSKLYSREWRKRNPSYSREWKRAHPEHHRPYTLKARKKYLSNPDNRVKHNARNTVYQAVKSGRLTRPEVCSRCGNTGKIEADHHDYSKPYDVTWLCHPCHSLVTKERRVQGL